jgi:integrase/recombinase XerD
MLSPHLLELLRVWCKAGRPQGWLFPGQNQVNPLATRQFNRACHAAAHMAGIDRRVGALCFLGSALLLALVVYWL